MNTCNGTLWGLNVQLRKANTSVWVAQVFGVINTGHVLLSIECRCVFFTDLFSLAPFCPVWGQLPSHAPVFPHDLPCNITYLKKPHSQQQFERHYFLKYWRVLLYLHKLHREEWLVGRKGLGRRRTSPFLLVQWQCLGQTEENHKHPLILPVNWSRFKPGIYY